MMDKKNNHIVQFVEDGLRNAMNEVKNKRGISRQDDKTPFKRIVYNGKYNLVVVEIGQEQLIDLPESAFVSSAISQIHSYCSSVDVIDLGESIFVYCWITKDEKDEKAETLSLEYAI